MQVLPAVALSTFLGLLRKIPATDPVLVLGLLEGELDLESEEHSFLNEIFGYSKKNQYRIPRPDEVYLSALVVKDFTDRTLGESHCILPCSHYTHPEAPKRVPDRS